MFLGTELIFSDMFTLKIIHELMDKFCNSNFRQVTMGFIPDEAHGENV